MTTPTQTARRANEQIRRLRAALQDARDTLCDHFGAQDDSVTACDRALAPDKPIEFEREAVRVTALGAAMMVTRVDSRLNFKCTCLTNQLGPHYCERHAA